MDDRRSQLSGQKSENDSMKRDFLNDMSSVVSKASAFFLDRKVSVRPALRSLSEKRHYFEQLKDEMHILDGEYLYSLSTTDPDHSAVKSAATQLLSSIHQNRHVRLLCLVLSRIVATELNRAVEVDADFCEISTGKDRENQSVADDLRQREASEQRLVFEFLTFLLKSARDDDDIRGGIAATIENSLTVN